MEACDSEWRGLGMIPMSGLKLRERYQDFDARIKYGIPKMEGRSNPACRCGEVLQGKCTPTQCPLFGKGCTPLHPVGACMVSGKEPALRSINMEKMGICRDATVVLRESEDVETDEILRRCIYHRKTQAGSSSPPPRQADYGNSMIIFS